VQQPNYSIIRAERVRKGVKLVTDGGFTCMPDHATRTVMRDDGGLYVRCEEGHHYLDGQFCGPEEHDAGFDHYVGFWIKGEEPKKEKPAPMHDGHLLQSMCNGGPL
jgi:hypothetical protein